VFGEKLTFNDGPILAPVSVKGYVCRKLNNNVDSHFAELVLF
jgi:hypothetical protein